MILFFRCSARLGKSTSSSNTPRAPPARSGLKTPCGVHTAAPRILARRFVAVGRGSSISKSRCGVSLSVFCVPAGSWRVLGGSWLVLAVLGPLPLKNGSTLVTQGGPRGRSKARKQTLWNLLVLSAKNNSNYCIWWPYGPPGALF